MKKIFVLIVCSMLSATMYAQSNVQPEGCPPGQCPAIYWEIEVINFHKPRTGCCCGFGFCIKLGPAQITCRPCYYLQGGGTSIAGSKATVVATIVNNKLELHIPIGINDQTGYGSVDFSTFTIDPEAIVVMQGDKKIGTTKAGEYPVTRTTTEFIVLIDLQ
jgi:hypothetical protein